MGKDLSQLKIIFFVKHKNTESLENTKLSAMFSASLRGFEPPAYRLGGGRSIQLSYSDNRLTKNYFTVKML